MEKIDSNINNRYNSSKSNLTKFIPNDKISYEIEYRILKSNHNSYRNISGSPRSPRQLHIVGESDCEDKTNEDIPFQEAEDFKIDDLTDVDAMNELFEEAQSVLERGRSKSLSRVSITDSRTNPTDFIGFDDYNYSNYNSNYNMTHNQNDNYNHDSKISKIIYHCKNNSNNCRFNLINLQSNSTYLCRIRNYYNTPKYLCNDYKYLLFNSQNTIVGEWSPACCQFITRINNLEIANYDGKDRKGHNLTFGSIMRIADDDNDDNYYNNNNENSISCVWEFEVLIIKKGITNAMVIGITVGNGYNPKGGCGNGDGWGGFANAKGFGCGVTTNDYNKGSFYGGNGSLNSIINNGDKITVRLDLINKVLLFKHDKSNNGKFINSGFNGFNAKNNKIGYYFAVSTDAKNSHIKVIRHEKMDQQQFVIPRQTSGHY